MSWLRPFLAQLSISPKGAGTIRFDRLWPAQDRIVAEVERAADENRPCRIIVCKARQLGISTVSEALLFAHAIAYPGSTGVVVAHDLDSTRILFGHTKLFYDSYPYRRRYPTRASTTRKIELKNTRSSIEVLTAGARTVGLGRRINNLHISEFAMWRNTEDLYGGLRQAVPDIPRSLIIIESTSKGLGNLFEQMWTEAESGRNEYTPLFFPWFEHPEYLPCGGVCEDGTCVTCVGHAAGVHPKDDDERDLVKLGCGPAQLAWRRWAVQNRTFGNVDLFREQFPSCAEESFVSSGINTFPETHIRRCFQQTPWQRGRLQPDPTRLGHARFLDDPNGPLRVYKRPGAGQQYFLGADACFGHGPDRAAAHVINRESKEQVAVWHGKINPIAFADECAALASFYNRATIAGEVFGPGTAFISRLQAVYPHLWMQVLPDRAPGRDRSNVMVGFATNWRTKAWLVANLANMLERGEVILHDRPTYGELRCVPADSEALTRDGWRTHDRLTVGDELLTYDVDADRFEWQPMTALSVYPFSGDLQTIRGFRATFNHRWPVQIASRSHKRVVRQGDHLKRTDSLIQVAADTVFPDEGESILSARDAAILGWIVTDGTFRMRTGWGEAVIYQSEGKYLREIQVLVGSEGSTRIVHGYRPGRSRGRVMAVNVSTTALRRLREAGFDGKDDLSSIITRLSRPAAEAMWDAMMKAEGSSAAAHMDGAVFTQVHGAVRDAFQVLSLLLGYRVETSVRGRDAYIANLNGYQRRLRRVYEVGTERYDGAVWCPTTPNGTWVMRQNGRAVITGNSFVWYGSSDQFGPAQGAGHDDLVMALGICLLCESTSPAVPPDADGSGWAPAMPATVGGFPAVWGVPDEDAPPGWPRSLG